MMTVVFANEKTKHKRTVHVMGDSALIRRNIIGGTDGKPVAVYMNRAWVVLEKSGDPRWGRRYPDVEITMGEEG